MSSITSIQGIASGIQWQDMVDQLIAVDQSRELDPITAQLTANSTKSGTWSSYRTVAQSLADAAAALRNGTAFGGAQASGGTSSATGRTLFSATAATGAQPGQYQVEVLGVAQAEKIGGNAVTSIASALGLSGSFTVNGQKVTVASTDSLAAVRDAINTKSASSHVTATILGAGNGTSRLVLTSNVAGSRGIELVDSAAGGVLTQLGLTDGSYSVDVDANGNARGASFAASDTAVGTSLGLTPPAATSIRVGNVSISVDLATDSLSDIATRLQAAGVDAQVTSTTDTGATTYYLSVAGNVSAVPDASNAAIPDANSLRTLEMLGFARGGRSAVSLSFAVGATSTLDDLVTALNGNGGFGGGTRAATASIGADGSIKLTDGTAGGSQLAMSLSVTKSVANGGGATGVGAFKVESAGRQREIVAGSDAQVRVDGVLVQRNSNTITDAVNGVTLKLQQGEVGTTSTLTVSRDTSAAVSSVQAFAKAFNDVLAFVSKNTATGAPLDGNQSLRASGRSLTQAMLTDVLGSSISRATLVGVSLDKTGNLVVDGNALTTALQGDETGVKTLFGLNGTVTGASLEYIAAGDSTVAGSYNVDITAAATTPSVNGTGGTFPFDDGGVSRTLSLIDGATGKTGSVTLATGDGAQSIADKLNAMFTSKGLLLAASVANGALSINGTQYGSAASFTVAYGSGDTTSATQLGIGAQKYSGTDVAGTIDGITATGSGQTLTANTGANAAGLVLRYFGTATGAVGSATVTVGAGAIVSRIARSVTLSGDGLVDTMTHALDLSTTTLLRRSDEAQARLDRKKAQLQAQFTAMETAIGQIQAEGARLTSFINSLQSSSR